MATTEQKQTTRARLAPRSPCMSSCHPNVLSASQFA